MTNIAARRTRIRITEALVDGVSLAGSLLVGAFGTYAAYRLAPATWTGDARLLLAGAAAVVAAISTGDFVESLLAPARRFLRAQTTAVSTSTKDSVPPDTLGIALAQAVAATETDAARRAAFGAHVLDDGDGYLGAASRWRGYEDGEATFYLAPGLVLHYRGVPKAYGTAKEFTLLTSDADEPVAITSLAQLRHHLAARAAGLPLAEPMAQREDDELLNAA
ncbi:hypothetical protein ACFYZH_31895 [Streptomyces abikoensis]|uniref:hypothetical protein n=1 Tax=Streptomyces abikoensis TaxID=97398 RepID=UPI0036C6D194